MKDYPGVIVEPPMEVHELILRTPAARELYHSILKRFTPR